MSSINRIVVQLSWRKTALALLCVTGTITTFACGLCIRPVRPAHSGLSGPATAAPARAVAELATQESGPLAGAAGIRVYKDPFTFKFTPLPQNQPVLQLTGTLATAFSTSGEGLQAVRSTVANGGFVLNLRGRFQNGMVARMNAEGEVVATCVADPSGLPASTQPCH